MDNDSFRPEYAGDNQNSAWVRAMMDKKGFKIDRIKLIKRMSAISIGYIFYDMIQDIRGEFPDA